MTERGRAVDFERQIDQKVGQMIASGMDPGPATGALVVEGAGAYRTHRGAVITAHPVAGIHEVHGSIMERYFNRMGGPASYVGYPTSDETAVGAGRYNTFEFQGSHICW